MRELLARLGRGARSSEPPVIDVDDPDLHVVVEAFDDAEAASTALARAPHWQPDRPAVLRHYLSLPSTDTESVATLLHEDGWTVRESVHGPIPEEPANTSDGEQATTVIALRVQRLDALHCAQASARMAGLAQRFRGRALGWDALQPGQAN
uniref:hypothetical protein n=1 Tax=Haloactinomyces albus TaxID=1352928 RepID=UPI0035B55FDE